ELTGASCYITSRAGEGLIYSIPRGTLRWESWISADFLQMSDCLLVLTLRLFTSDEDPCICRFTLLPSAQATLRFPLEGAKQNRWLYPREGALLKPTMSGARLIPEDVVRLEITTLYTREGAVTWEMTQLTLTFEEPEVLKNPLLPKGLLLDRWGQAE